jgi:hypothetical protein
MIALAVLSLAGAALLNSVAGAVQSSNDAIYRSVGQGLAEQLLEEIAAAKFPNGSASLPSATPFRGSFTSIDDYANFSERPPRTKSGEVLGNDDGATPEQALSLMLLGKPGTRLTELDAAPNFVGRFTRSALVERVLPTMSGWNVVPQHTPHRRVTVTVSYTANSSTRTVAQVVRVFSAVSPSP